jgi:peptide/nickel transport system permease protein
MIKYIIKRILMIIPIVLGVIFVIFVMLYFLAGSSIRQMPISGDGDFLDSIFTFFNAGDNFVTKYIRYCWNILIKLDFGRSGNFGVSLARELRYRIRNTLFLLGSGVGVMLIVGIPTGVCAAVRKNRPGDRIINIATLLFSAIPGFSTAFFLTLVFAVYLKIMPVLISYTSPKAFLLPALTIALGGVASIARMVRASMIETLEQPYIIALRSKGLNETGVVYRHALKNALVPVVAVLGGLVSRLLLGTLVVEHFFSVPGLGSLMMTSVGMRDHNTILGCTAILTVILTATNIATDILYAFINPQIKLMYAAKSAADREMGPAE